MSAKDELDPNEENKTENAPKEKSEPKPRQNINNLPIRANYLAEL